MYKCSSCSRTIGFISEPFKCPHSGRTGHAIAQFSGTRKAPAKPKWLEGEDLSRIAKPHRTKVKKTVAPDPWGGDRAY